MSDRLALWFAFLAGAGTALLAAWGLYGAPLDQPMATSADGWGDYGPRYIVHSKRFDWFYPSRGPAGYHANCWGGHTLDGRCISLVSASGPIFWLPNQPHADPIRNYKPAPAEARGNAK